MDIDNLDGTIPLSNPLKTTRIDQLSRSLTPLANSIRYSILPAHISALTQALLVDLKMYSLTRQLFSPRLADVTRLSLRVTVPISHSIALALPDFEHLTHLALQFELLKGSTHKRIFRSLAHLPALVSLRLSAQFGAKLGNEPFVISAVLPKLRFLDVNDAMANILFADDDPTLSRLTIRGRNTRLKVRGVPWSTVRELRLELSEFGAYDHLKDLENAVTTVLTSVDSAGEEHDTEDAIISSANLPLRRLVMSYTALMSGDEEPTETRIVTSTRLGRLLTLLHDSRLEYLEVFALDEDAEGGWMPEWASLGFQIPSVTTLKLEGTTLALIDESDRQDLAAFVAIFPNLSRLYLSARIDPSEVILPESLLKEHRTELVRLVADLERSSPRIVEIALDRSVATDPAAEDSGDHPVALDQPFSCERQTWTRRSPDDAFEPRSGVVEGGRVLFA